MKLLGSFLIIVFSLHARAGIETHGGDFLECRCRQSMVLDYYQATLPTVAGQTNLVNIGLMTTKETIDFFVSRLEGLTTYPDIARVMKTVGDYQNWVVVDRLTDKNDEDLPYIPEDCEIIQAAIRLNGRVYVSKQVLDMLTPSQLAVLVIHEVLAENFVNYQKENPGVVVSSDHTRSVIAELLKEQPNYVNIARIFNMYGKRSSPFCMGAIQGQGYFAFASTTGAAIFDVEDGGLVDFVNNRFEHLAMSGFYLADGYLFSRVVSSSSRKVVAASNMKCSPRTNSCVGVAGGEFPNFHRSFELARKYGAVKLELGSVAKLSFSNDPNKSVLRTNARSYPQGPCVNLDQMWE